MYNFYNIIYNEYIGPYFLSHVVLRFPPVNSSSCNQMMSKTLCLGPIGVVAVAICIVVTHERRTHSWLWIRGNHIQGFGKTQSLLKF
jgi:hypothetical protein